MTNKLRRSMTSVLLAASLLFSSQSVVAFADYGSKSDASDLSPVQESVENATEEQQEDPSLSVEPVIGESTEAPVAAPMMARANAPVSYSAPRLDDYHTYFEENYSSDFASIAVYTRVPNSIEADGKEQENYFIQGSGWQVYKALPVEGWIFKNWSYSLTKNGGSNDLGNLKDLLDRYTFSDADSDWYAPYSDSSDNKDRISINAINRELKNGLTAFDTLHHSIYANYNPLVTVNVGENGTVTYNNTEVSHEDSGKKVEVEYGTAPDFTITPDTGYKVASVTFGDTTIQANEDGTYPLPSVTEPTTLNVEFEKAEDVITVDDIDGAVIINVLCPNGHSHLFNMSEGTAGQQGDYYIMSSNPLKANVSIISKAWVKKFNELTGMVQHELTGYGYITFELTRDGPNEKWKLPKNAKQYNVTINVKCTSEIPEPDESIISQLEVALNCVNVTDGSHNDTSELSTYTTGYYTCEVDKVNRTATVSITEDQAKYWINNNINTMVGKEQHSFVSVSDPITLTYKNGQWKVPEDDNAKKIVIKMLCGPSIAQLNDQLNVKMVCDNNGVHSGNNEQFSREYDILADSYHLDMYSVGGKYRCDVTIDAPQYLSKFDQDTNATHVLMSSDNKRTLYYTEDGNWLIVPDEEKTVTFNVSCKPDINFPNPPDKETVLGLIGDVTIQCTTASSGHGQNKYSLTKDDIDFENVVPVQMTAGDEIQFTLPVTIKNAAALQSGFLANYNTLTGKTHIWSSGSIPASITLTYDSVTKAWANKDVNGIVLSVYCTTGGGTIDPNPNPGGGGDNDDDDDRYTGDNTVTRTINDDDVPLNDRPNNTTTIDDEDVPLADLPDDTVTIDDGEVPLKANPSTGDSLPFAAMAAAALSLGGVIVLNRKKK